jgi:lysophospholipase L1-like esterase
VGKPRFAFVLLLIGACAGGNAGGDDDDDAPDGGGGPGPSADARPDDIDPGADAAPAGQTVADCFADAFVTPVDPEFGPDYDQFGPVVASHCLGTNHQQIDGIQRVVFLGDSVTVGSPPTGSGDFYRSVLADRLVAKFGLEAPGALWEQLNIFEGTALAQTGGDFAICAKWGARTDDLMEDNAQVADCFPSEELGKRTLVILTIGGNDISSITKAGLDGAPVEETWAQTQEFVGKLRAAIEWIKAPGRFPNGVFVVFANMYEFTDGTGDTDSCPGAGLAGYGGEWADPDALAEMVVWANEQYAKIAVDTGSDMIFLLESFCGHGFLADDPSALCYRGPGNERWFDDTCIHPNPVGHTKVADMFMAVVNE